MVLERKRKHFDLTYQVIMPIFSYHEQQCPERNVDLGKNANGPLILPCLSQMAFFLSLSLLIQS